MGMKQAFGKDSLVAQTVKHLPAMQETRAWSLGREDSLEKEMATHSSTLAWKTPWMEESGRLQSMGSQRVQEDWATSLSLWGRKDASVKQSHRKKINVDQMHTEGNKFTKISLFIGGLDGKLGAMETQADSKQPLLDSSFVSSLSQLTLNYCPWPPLRDLSLRPISRTSPISNTSAALKQCPLPVLHGVGTQGHDVVSSGDPSYWAVGWEDQSFRWLGDQAQHRSASDPQ